MVVPWASCKAIIPDEWRWLNAPRFVTRICGKRRSSFVSPRYICFFVVLRGTGTRATCSHFSHVLLVSLSFSPRSLRGARDLPSSPVSFFNSSPWINSTQRFLSFRSSVLDPSVGTLRPCSLIRILADVTRLSNHVEHDARLL